MLNKETVADPGKGTLSFENTEIAFRHSSNTDLKRAYWLFRMININFFCEDGSADNQLRHEDRFAYQRHH